MRCTAWWCALSRSSAREFCLLQPAGARRATARMLSWNDGHKPAHSGIRLLHQCQVSKQHLHLDKPVRDAACASRPHIRYRSSIKVTSWEAQVRLTGVAISPAHARLTPLKKSMEY